MQKLADIELKDNVFLLSGDLHFSNAMAVYQKSLPLLNKSQDLHFDFSQLKSSDSSGLALVVDWLKYANKEKKPVKFMHLSEDLLSIAKAAGISGMIVG